MKKNQNLNNFLFCFFGIFCIFNNVAISQGNNNGNANPNNNANPNALKWETHGNQADTSEFIGTTNPAPLKFKSDNVERLRITEDGKVGIGTTDPTRELEVLGNTMLRGDLFLPILDTMSSYNSENILFLNGNDKVVKGGEDFLKSLVYLPVDNDIITYCEAMVGIPQLNPTWSNGTNKIYSACADVSVGIGTPDPQKLLDVRGTTQTYRLEVGQEYSSSSLISGFRTGVTNYPILTLGQHNSQLQTEHVALQLKSYGQLSLNYKDFQYSTSGEVLTINSNDENIFKINAEGNLYLNYLGQGQVLTIRSEIDNRKLLQLESDGLLRARKVRIDLESWADFVFMEEYELMSLGELKNYVQTNKHLPNVPSEKELREEGLDLAEMNKILMQKVEELTLYVLEQNDKTEELQREIEALKLKVASLK